MLAPQCTTVHSPSYSTVAPVIRVPALDMVTWNDLQLYTRVYTSLDAQLWAQTHGVQ